MNNETALAIPGKEHLHRLMGQMEVQIADVLPTYLDAARQSKLILVEASKNPDIYRCCEETPVSVTSALMLASELGLEPGAAQGHLYLIPRKMKDPVRGGRKYWQLTTMIGYRGFAEMARRSTDIKRLNAGVVYQEQVDRGLFVWTDEPPDIRVEGAALKERKTDAALVYAWALVEMHNGAKYVEVLDRTDIERRRAKAGRTGNGSPWGDWFPRMARKSAIRALLDGGLVPLNGAMQRAVAHEAEADPAPEAAVVNSTPLVAEAEEVDPLRTLLSIPQKGAQVEPFDGRAAVLEQIAEFEGALNEAGVEDARREMKVDDLTRLGLDELKAYRNAVAERSF